MNKIVLVDDEQDILDILHYNLSKEGFEVHVALNGNIGLELCQTIRPDLAILDVMMPEMDGIELCEKLRSIPEMSNLLICFLTARNEDYSQIAGLDAGADDYISKPIKPKVLISKVKALLRRKNTAGEQIKTHQPTLIIDREKYQVIHAGKIVRLPRKEFELLALLASKPESVFERDAILAHVWGTDIVVGDRTIDVHVRKIREKIDANCIQTIKGVGYKFIEV